MLSFGEIPNEFQEEFPSNLIPFKKLKEKKYFVFNCLIFLSHFLFFYFIKIAFLLCLHY